MISIDSLFLLSFRFFIITIAMAMLAGCTSFSRDSGFQYVQQTVQQRINKDISWIKNKQQQSTIDAHIRDLLQRPLTADDAVQIALLNNKNLQARYADLGIAEADLVQAGRLANPSFSFGRFTRGGEIEIEHKLSLPLLGLLVMPMAIKVEQQRFKQVQLETIREVLRLAHIPIAIETPDLGSHNKRP